MNVAELQPRRHDPPPGWDAETFGQLTDALAAALVAAHRRAPHDDGAADRIEPVAPA
jgi:hypothetical protein